jgi:hypothetical protein
MAAMTRISDLRRPYGATEIPSWPPRWIPTYDGASDFQPSDDGILTWIERMPDGPGLWLTMRSDGIARRGPLLWSGPPNLVELERVLQRQIGRRIRDIGYVEIGAEPMLELGPILATERAVGSGLGS